mgnify:CR=1 FL=1
MSEKGNSLEVAVGAGFWECVSVFLPFFVGCCGGASSPFFFLFLLLILSLRRGY